VNTLPSAEGRRTTHEEQEKSRAHVRQDNHTNCVICSRSTGECLVTTTINPSRISVSQVRHSHLVRPLCMLLVNGPVQLTFERLVCAECVIQMLHLAKVQVHLAPVVVLQPQVLTS